MTYQEKLKDDRWLQRRDYILHRDKHKCQSVDCHGKSNILQVHHVDYIKGFEPWDYPEDMLINLCRDCHKMEQSRKKAERQLLDALKMKGFLLGDIMALRCKFDTDDDFAQSLLNTLRN